MGIVISDRNHILSAPNTAIITADALRRHHEDGF